jgi:hypothetical protein
VMRSFGFERNQSRRSTAEAPPSQRSGEIKPTKLKRGEKEAPKLSIKQREKEQQDTKKSHPADFQKRKDAFLMVKQQNERHKKEIEELNKKIDDLKQQQGRAVAAAGAGPVPQSVVPCIPDMQAMYAALTTALMHWQ